MLFDAKFTKCLQKCQGKVLTFCHNSKMPILVLHLTAMAGVFPARHAHLVIWVYPEGFYDTMSLYDCTTLNYIFQKNLFIHYNNYCSLNNIIILIKTKRYGMFMSKLMAVITFYKFSNTQSVLSTKYVYILNEKHELKKRLIKIPQKLKEYYILY